MDSKLILDMRTELRKEHFAFGSDHSALKTTYMQYTPHNEVKECDKRMNQNIKAEMRGHHFVFGTSPD